MIEIFQTNQFHASYVPCVDFFNIIMIVYKMYSVCVFLILVLATSIVIYLLELVHVCFGEFV